MATKKKQCIGGCGAPPGSCACGTGFGKKDKKKRRKPVNRAMTKNFGAGFFFAMAELSRQGVDTGPMVLACSAAGYKIKDIGRLPIEPYDIEELNQLMDEIGQREKRGQQ